MTFDVLRTAFQQDGYIVVKGLFRSEEVEFYRDHFMQLRASGGYPGDLVISDNKSNDPLKKFPRMIHMHRWDQVSRQWLLDQRIADILTALLGNEPYAVQTMLYFKPPLARGQALHQDNYYLRAAPGSCIAAWLALDPCDEANGCMQIVPGSHHWPILCTTEADTKESFTDVTVPIPEGQEVRAISMDAGDVLFFGGSLVHGSYPNKTRDRFRRSLIGHYASGAAEQLVKYSQPALRMDGTEVTFKASEGGGPCGVWVEEDGKPVIEMAAAGVHSSEDAK